MTVWRSRCTEHFGEDWGVPWTFAVDGVVRLPHAIAKGRHETTRIRDSIFADDTAIMDMKLRTLLEDDRVA